MSKILVIGASGQLGYDLVRIFSSNFQVIKVTHNDLDITDEDSVYKFIKRHKPEVIINTAAFHKTSECEKNPELSFTVNSFGAYYLSKAAKMNNSIIVYISTNYVFDGNKSYYSENDIPNPINIYGASKYSGEILTSIANTKHYIIRTSGLFGVQKSGKGYNFVQLMLQKAKNGEAISVVDDENSSFTYTLDLSHKLKELLEKKASFGTYHIVNSGIDSWYSLAQETFRLSNLDINILHINSNDRISEFNRPLNSGLKSVNLNKCGLKQLRHWKLALKSYISELNQL